MTRLIAIYIIVLVCIVSAVFIFVPARVRADDTCFAFDTLGVNYAAKGERIVQLSPPATKALGKRMGIHATRGFVVLDGDRLLLGLEVDGCTLPPIVLGPGDMPMAFSGVGPFGTMA